MTELPGQPRQVPARPMRTRGRIEEHACSATRVSESYLTQVEKGREQPTSEARPARTSPYEPRPWLGYRRS